LYFIIIIIIIIVIATTITVDYENLIYSNFLYTLENLIKIYLHIIVIARSIIVIIVEK
jgi:hypothetical protein